MSALRHNPHSVGFYNPLSAQAEIEREIHDGKLEILQETAKALNCGHSGAPGSLNIMAALYSITAETAVSRTMAAWLKGRDQLRASVQTCSPKIRGAITASMIDAVRASFKSGYAQLVTL